MSPFIVPLLLKLNRMKGLFRNDLLEYLECCLWLERRLHMGNPQYYIHTTSHIRVCTHYFMTRLVHPTAEQVNWTHFDSTKRRGDERNGRTHAKEKLSTFCTAAMGVDPMEIFVNGVLCNVSLPYQSIASTTACPPTQLQLGKRAVQHGNLCQ